jgi:hypothetical protein
MQAISELILVLTPSVSYFLRKSLTSCSVLPLKVRSTSDFVVKNCCEVSAKNVYFFQSCGRSFPIIGKGWDVRIGVC